MRTLGNTKRITEATDDGAAAEEATAYFPTPLPPQFASRCRRVAALSLLPGLGQLRNGEIAKGLLFLAVTFTNVLFLFVLFCGDKLRQPLSGLSAAFHHEPNWSLVAPLQQSLLQGPVFGLYLLLLLSFVAYAVRDAYDKAAAAMLSGQRLPRMQLTLPEATSGSYLMHFTCIAVFGLMLVLVITPPTAKQQVTDIELVKEPSKPNPAPKRHQPKKPAVVKPMVKPKPVIVPAKVVRIEKPKPTPVAVAVPTKEPTPIQAAPVEAPAAPPQTAPTPAADSGSGNGQPGTGSGSGEADVDMGPYMRALQQRIKLHWFPPKGNENKRIKVSFKVFKDGHIGHLRLLSSSGVGMADDAAMQAVQEAAPFAGLPDGVGSDIDINFTFDYHVFGGR